MKKTLHRHKNAPEQKEKNFQGGLYRDYKSRLFTMIYHDRSKLLELYNAMNGTSYEDPELLTINTLGNAIYMSMKNDISFIIDDWLNLYEHQSTYNPNLPVRCLMYITDVYSALIKDENIYGTKLIKLPTPRFVVFYNGTRKQPGRQVFRLSDAFEKEEKQHSLELKVIMMNINRGYNRKIMQECKTLHDYAEYTARVRKYAKTLDIEEAVEKAIEECIKEDILSEFLSKNRAEAKMVSIYEYDEEKHMRQERETSWFEGHEIGKKEGRNEGRKEGRNEGQEQINELNRRLVKDDRMSDLRRSIEDKEFQKQLILEYGL